MTGLDNKKSISAYMGKTVHVIVDRPIGSTEIKKDKIVYEVNCGYVEDENKLKISEAYVLGIREPIEVFDGTVIGIIRNINNNQKDKMVVAPQGLKLNQVEIEDMLSFNENFDTSYIEYMYHKSCGAIIYRKIRNKIEYLVLYQMHSMTWSFPKGHSERGEREEDTALREVLEETGISTTLIPGFKEELSYKVGEFGEKNVVLFAAEGNTDITIQKEEIIQYRWCKKEEAVKLLVHDEYKDILDKLENIIIHNEIKK